ncbi:MAG: HAD family phosphatase [Bacteroidales bacterium]
MTKNHSYIAAFDLDKTILSVNSSRLVVKMSRKLGLITKRNYRKAIFYSFAYKFDLQDANEIVLSMMQWLKGLKEEVIKDLAGKYIVPEVKNMVRPEMIEAVNYHYRNNARVILLSSALPYLCDPIAELLGMDDVVCSRLETRDGCFTGRSVGRLVFGPEKAVRMKAYCNSHNFPSDTAWYYGDAYADRYVLESIGHAVCVKPEIKLRWLAKKKGWKII